MRKEDYIKYQRKYYKMNKTRLLEEKKEYYIENKEKFHERYKKNCEDEEKRKRISQYNKQYYEKNKLRIHQKWRENKKKKWLETKTHPIVFTGTITFY
jgi:hypothetical protein